MKRTASFVIVFLALISSLYAQDSSGLKLSPLDEDAILKRLEDYNQLQLEVIPYETDSVDNVNNQYSMRYFDVEESDMANMPRMKIKEDMHYNMRIKKYTNYYGKFVNKDSLAQQRNRVLPLKPKD